MKNLPDPKAIDIDLIRAEKSKRSLKEFIKQFWHIVEPTTPFCDNWHIDCFVDHLANIRQIKNLLLNVPPGCAKSLIFSVFFFCWEWVHNPSQRFLYSSYALNLSERDSVKCRRLISSALYQKCFGNVFQVTSNVDTKRQFENDKTGYRQAISIGSQTKGLKGNFCILDDPHNASDVDSEIKKTEAVTWFDDSWYDRLSDFNEDCRIVIGQRIAKDDLSNHILENYKEVFTNLIIPYEYKPTTFVSPIGWIDPRKEEGEPLWEKKFPASEIRQLKRKSKTFSAQWNQNPIDSENALFHPADFRYYQETDNAYQCGDKRIVKTDCWRICAIDLAIATHNRADYTVILICDVSRTGEIILVYMLRERISGTKLIPIMKSINDQYQPAFTLMEDVAFQRMALDQARQEGIAVRACRPDGDKETRTLPLQIRFESNQVWFPQDKDWLPILETELMEFPNSRHDDIVDTLAYIGIEVGKRNRQRPEKPQPVQKTAEQLYNEALFHGLR